MVVACCNDTNSSKIYFIQFLNENASKEYKCNLDYSKMNKGLMLVSVITNNEELMKQEFLKALIPLEKEKVKHRTDIIIIE